MDSRKQTRWLLFSADLPILSIGLRIHSTFDFELVQPVPEAITLSNNENNFSVEAMQRLAPFVGTILFATVVILLGLSRVGCANHHVPPGHEGYVRSRPIFGAAEYVGALLGPTSTGWVWRQELEILDMRPRTHASAMTIRDKEGNPITFNAYAEVGLRAGSAKTVIERHDGNNWYQESARKTFEESIRSKVQALGSFEVKNSVNNIASEVLAEMVEYNKDRPFEFLSVNIGNIQYPDAIVESVVNKFVTYHENELAEIRERIKIKEVSIGRARAEGVADAQKQIRATLDPMYLQYEALQAIEQLATSNNTTFLIVPFGKSGMSPIIMNMDTNDAK